MASGHAQAAPVCLERSFQRKHLRRHTCIRVVMQPHCTYRCEEQLHRAISLMSLVAGRLRAWLVSSALRDSGAAMAHIASQTGDGTSRMCCIINCREVRLECRAERMAASKADASSASAASEPAAEASAAREDTLSRDDCTRAYAWPSSLRGVLPAETWTSAGFLQLEIGSLNKLTCACVHEGSAQKTTECVAGKFLTKAKALSNTDCTRAYARPNHPLKGVLPAEILAGAGSLQPHYVGVRLHA